MIGQAARYLRAGLSVIPVRADGTKAPALPAGHALLARSRRATDKELCDWFGPDRNLGVAIQAGAISGGLAVIDFDDPSAFAPWRLLVEDQAPGLLRSCPTVHTPRRSEAGEPGVHVYARVAGPPVRCHGLAWTSDGRIRIEVKAEGGATVAPPSSGRVHETGRAWELAPGSAPIESVPTLTEEEWELLASAARSLDEKPAAFVPHPAAGGPAEQQVGAPASGPKVGTRGKRRERAGAPRPGEDFNARGDVRALLTECGATLVRVDASGVEHWRRPGAATRGIDATLGRCRTSEGAPCLHVFSTSWSPLQAGKTYDPFALYAVLRHGSDFSSAARQLASEGYGPRPPGPPAPGRAPEDRRPEITAGQGDLRDIVAAAWKAVSEYNSPPRLFRFGESAAVVSENESGEPSIRQLSPDALRGHLADAAWWYTEGSHGRRDAKAPRDVAVVMLAGNLSSLPGLRGVVRAPIMTPTGRLLESRGHDEETKTYYYPNGLKMPDVPQEPSPGDVRAAGELLLSDLLGDFPFVDQSDRANALAMYVLPFVREVIAGPTPLHLIEKPSAGSGGSLLIEALGLIVQGSPPALMTEGNDEDEMRKRITAALREGPSMLAIDNVRRRIESAALSSALTARVWKDRLLGASENVEIPVRCVWIASGNNPAVSSEIARRCVSIRIDPKLERPWERPPEGFRHPELLKWVRQNRGRLVAACLTLARAWHARGRPQGKAVLGSYEDWAAVMGGLLDVAGVAGFMGNRSRFYERADKEASTWRSFVTAWRERYGDMRVGVRQLWDLVSEEDIPFDLGKGSDRSQRTRLGDAISRSADKRFVIDGVTVRIAADGVEHRAAQYRLVPITEPEFLSKPTENDEVLF